MRNKKTCSICGKKILTGCYCDCVPSINNNLIKKKESVSYTLSALNKYVTKFYNLQSSNKVKT